MPKLQKAHERASHKALADVISMVNHATENQQPILTAEERLTRAMSKIMETQAFTTEQRQWLSLIQQHLITNLRIDEEDFDLTPLLQRRGGKTRVVSVISNYPDLITTLNEYVAK